MKKIILLFVFASVKIFSQPSSVKPCSAAESNQFDFWLGSWNLTYSDTVHASNVITREQDGCVVYEHFKDPSSKMTGSSWSVYNPVTKKWQQTWVDNQGGYIVLTGAMQNNEMILYTEPASTPKGGTIKYKMIFYNITAKNFDWSWESTRDEGKTWQAVWKIHYDRVIK